MANQTACPRMAEAPYLIDFKYENKPNDGTCDYCGSLLPDEFMRRLEAGDVELGTTHKDYKVYVHNSGGDNFRHASRTDGGGHGMDQSKWTWGVKESDRTKFYFQHLSKEQLLRFVDLLNANKIKMYGGYNFSPLPFFVSRGARD